MEFGLQKLIEKKESENFKKSNNLQIFFEELLQFVSIHDLTLWLSESFGNLQDPWKEIFDLIIDPLNSLNVPTSLAEDDLQQTYVPALMRELEPLTSSLKISYHLQDLKSLLKSLKPTISTIQVKRPKSSSSASTTKKTKKTNTSTSTTHVPTINLIADASSSSNSMAESKNDSLSTLLENIPLKETYSKTLSSIYFKNQENYYTFKSNEIPLTRQFIDLKIYDSPQTLENMDQKDWWKCATTRMKVAVGRDSDLSQKAMQKLKELQELLIQDMNTYPGIQMEKGEIRKATM